MATVLGHIRAWRMDEAAEALGAVLAANPADEEALHLSGVVADAKGRPADGVALVTRALAIRETASYRSNLGMMLSHLGRHQEALVECERAIALRPSYPEALNNQGVAFEALRRWPEAEGAYREAIAARPGYAEAWSNLGNALRAMGRVDKAAAAYEQALASPAAGPEAQANRGQVLYQLGRFEEAMAACKRALALRPDTPEALTGLGNALRSLGRLDECETVCRRVIALRPAEVAAYNNLAITLQAMDRPLEALALLDLAAALDADDPETRHHRAILLLRAGRFAEAWPDYEYRFRIKHAGDGHKQFEHQPAWRGEDLGGRTILLVPEQGLGDSIQFARFAPLVAARGGRVLLGLQPQLARLFRNFPGVEQIVPAGSKLPRYDIHCPLLSIPGALGVTLDTIPGATPYLQPEPERAAWWAKRLRAGEAGLRVGVVWAGNPNHLGDRQRSMPFDALAPLWRAAGVRWFSLQAGSRAAEAAAQAEVEDLSPELADFADTAAAICNMDLVITVDTAVAHLAGALGRPVWVLLPHTPDWRWLGAGETSPWYPSMRLFRQDGRRSWGPVVARVAADVESLSACPWPVSRSSPGERLVLFQWGVSSYYGWGVYGLNLLLAWAARPGFRPASLQRIDPAELDLDPLERESVAPALRRSAQVLEGLQAMAGRQVTSAHLVLHAINNGMVRGRAAHAVDVLGTPQVGVAFLDAAHAEPGAAERLRGYEMLVAGSSWNRDLLLRAGAARVELVLQGVDVSHFHPAPRRNLFPGRFVVFSGGKLEYRKGQDLVLLAFRRFAERHPDALLLTAWSSPWPEAAATLAQTQAHAPPIGADGRPDAAAWTSLNGIPPHQVHHLGPVPNRAMPRILREAHAALFPNRAEGGTNLVAMECMACGVPTILSANTGHLDLIGEGRVVSLAQQLPLQGGPYRGWGESSVDEIVAALEAAYDDPAAMAVRADAAARFMAGLSWQTQMRTLGDLLQPFVA